MIHSSFNGQSELKSDVVAKAIALRRQSKFANASSTHRGFCSTSWIVNDPCKRTRSHKFARLIDVPEETVQILEFFFDYDLPNDRFQLMPEEFLTALPVGEDLSTWWKVFFLGLFKESSVSPVRHSGISKKTQSMFYALVDLYETFDFRDAGWKSLEQMARNAAQKSHAYYPKPNENNVDFDDDSIAYVDPILSYEYSAAWMVARACAYATRYSPWWSKGTIQRLFQLDYAYAIQVQKRPIDKVTIEPDYGGAEAYDWFLRSLSYFNTKKLKKQEWSQKPNQTKTTSHQLLSNQLSKQQFWTLIDESKNKSKSSRNQIRVLMRKLEKLTGNEILSFDFHLQEALRDAYRWDLWAVAYIINGGCSNSSDFEFFLGWLILQGKTNYDKALKDPTNVGSLVSPGEDVECSEILQLAETAYENVTDSSDFNERRTFVPRHIQGKKWKEDHVMDMYPKLTKRFSNGDSRK